MFLEAFTVECLILLFVTLGTPDTSITASSDNIVLNGINRQVYANPGDINIGAMVLLTTDPVNLACTDSTYPGSWGIEYPEAIAFAVNLVNKDPNLLPNVTLGFYILDDCSDRSIALAQAMTFLPRGDSSCSVETCNTTSATSSTLSSAYSPEEPLAHYDVVGVLSPMLSTSAVPVSYLYSVAKMPIVGWTTTSDEFSVKTLHPYFLRVVTPDQHQATAILEFIFSKGWSYISVVYSQGPYGESAFDNIKRLVKDYKICIATSHRVANSDNTDPVAEDLLEHSRARAVILFADQIPVRNLFKSIEKLNAVGQFIWIGSDSVTTTSKEKFAAHTDNIVGTFLFTYYVTQVPSFYDYLRKQNPLTSKNPWFLRAWEDTAQCSFEEGTCNVNDDIVNMTYFEGMPTPSLAMDAVLTFAHGIHNLISDLCPGVSGTDIENCVKRDILLKYLRNVTFEGFTGNIAFDNKGDMKGKYIIYQVTRSQTASENSSDVGINHEVVGEYDTAMDVVTFKGRELSWDHLIKRDRIVPLTANTLHPDVPESVCSRPCVVGEYKIQKELKCCWECKKCRDNEIIVNDNTGCEICPEFTWPDPATDYTTCSFISLSYPSVNETLPILQICLAILAIIGIVLTIGCYVHHRDTRVIKATSRELSALQLAGILVGYVTVICFQSTPTDNMCSALYYMFCLSFTWLYCPLLVKTVRIFRIFQSGSKHNKRPRFISPKSQLIMASILILLQILLCVVTFSIRRPTAKRTQPVATEKFVELSCDFTLPGLASFLTFNLVLVSLCSVFAFKTRKLPDNFNESRFISMCVSTTLVIWLAFIPTYFTAGREFVRMLLLSVALLLNHTVALVFLFVPKIYAAVYVSEENFVTTRFHNNATAVSQNASGTSNRVGPSPPVKGQTDLSQPAF